MDGVFSLFSGFSNHHSFTSGQTIGLDDDRQLLAVEEINGGGDFSELTICGGRDVVT